MVVRLKRLRRRCEPGTARSKVAVHAAAWLLAGAATWGAAIRPAWAAPPAAPPPAAPPAASPPARADAPPAYPAPAPATGMPAPGYAMAAPPLDYVYVEIRSNNPAVTVELADANLTRRAVCRTPCLTYLPRNHFYVVSGDGVPTTAQFMLPTDRPRLLLDVQAGSVGQQVGGVLMMVVAVPVIVVGFFGFLLVNALSGLDESGRDHDADAARFGIIMLGGLGLGVLGLLLRMNTDTRVTTDAGVRFSDDANRDTFRRPHRPPRFALTARGLEF